VTDSALVNRQEAADGAPDARPAVFLMTNTLETGGSERQFVTMAKALDRRKFSVSTGCLKPVGPLLAEVEGLNKFPAGGSLFGLQSWRSRLALARFLWQQDVAVAQSFDFYSNLMMIPAARLAGVSAVLGSHRQLGDLLTARQFRTQNAVFRLCDRVVCNSQAASARLRQAGVPTKKLAVVANGVPDEWFAEVVPAFPHEPGVVKVGMISRMNHALKNHEMFLSVTGRLAARLPQLHAVLVGDGPLRARLEELARQAGLSGRVSFLGDRRDVHAVMASLDVSVMPSSSESLSNVIIESMAAALPVVAADVGGNPELVRNGETGFLFPAGNEQKFAQALETLVSQPELRKEFGKRARERAKAEFTISQVRDCYQDLYQSVLAEKGWNTESLQLRSIRGRRQGLQL
jgi:glycosyltransferase involved in cell wall biosynthesis